MGQNIFLKEFFMFKMWWEIKGHLEVKNNKLYIGGKSSEYLAKKFGTPLYVLNINRVKENYLRLYYSLQKYLKRQLVILYSVKANSSLALLRVLKNLGAGVDAVSPFEVFLAKLSGFDKEEILFTGTSVSNEDMILIGRKAKINIDSLSQLERYAKLAKRYGFDKKISIRVNPEKGAGFISDCITAGKEAKFGIPKKDIFFAFKRALELGLQPIGLHQHIGSGILAQDLNIFLKAAEAILNLAGKLKKKFNLEFEFIDLGGGLGIPYKSSQEVINLEKFGKNLGETIEKIASKANLGNFDLYLEPGRYIVGDAEVLLVKVVDVSKKYVNEIGVNAGFNILDRPARYKTYHEIVNASRVKGETKLYRISGNLCESGDVFNETKYKLRKLPFIKEGDILAILNAGAYGLTMSSNYNLRPRPREIMIDKNKVKIIRERETFNELIATQRR